MKALAEATWCTGSCLKFQMNYNVTDRMIEPKIG